MIEINLNPNKKGNDLSQSLGIDFSLLNVKMLLLAIVLVYLPDFTVLEMWEEEYNTLNSQITTLRSEERKLKSKEAELTSFEEMVKALKAQETKLAAKLEVVKNILLAQHNPFQVIKYISGNIPESVWVKEIDINDTQLKIIGESLDWKSIGAFIENLKASIFLDKNIYYNQVKATGTKADRTTEEFVILARIVRFE